MRDVVSENLFSYIKEKYVALLEWKKLQFGGRSEFPIEEEFSKLPIALPGSTTKAVSENLFSYRKVKCMATLDRGGRN